MDKVNIFRSINRTSISVQIEHDGSIKVTAPPFIPEFVIKQFLNSKKDWIREKQLLMLSRNPKRADDEYLYLGKLYKVETRLQQKNVVELENGKLYVASSNEKYVKNYLTNWYKQQARKVILERVHRYAQALHLHYNSVSLMSATTRWGSCSSQKNLNFNWKLIMAPLPAIDYVVAHELAHLVELNHSRDFWETVRKMFPIYREYRTWFKRNGHTLTI